MRAAIALLLGIIVLGSPPAPAAEDRPVRSELRAGLLSLEATAQPWTLVVDELARTTGLAVRVLPKLEGTVTVSFEDLPVEHAVRRLFGPDVALVFGYDGPGSLAPPARVWILGPRREASAVVFAEPHPSQQPAVTAEHHWQEVEMLARQEALGAIPVLLAALSDPDLAVRKQAEELLCRLRSDPVLSMNGRSPSREAAVPLPGARCRGQ